MTDDLRAHGRVHIIGAGPVGLFLAALLQGVPGQLVTLYEKRERYTRTRMVALAEYLIAGSIDAYKADEIDGQDVEAIYDPAELELRLAYRRTVAPDLRALLDAWTQGFVPLNTIERELSDLIDRRATGSVERVLASATVESALAALEPGDVVVDCTGAHSLFRDLLDPGNELARSDRNTRRYRMEYALVITFLFSRHFLCNERCKYSKNRENPNHKFIPGIRRTYYDGDISHVTGFVTISPEEFEAIPPKSDGAWLREHYPEIVQSTDRFIAQVTDETDGHLIGDFEVTRIPLEVYGARNFTTRRWHESGLDHPLANAPVFLLGDAAIGSPYFQAISLGLENAFFLAGHLANQSMSMPDILERYEQFMFRQWIRVFMRTQMIKHNKDLLQSVDDTHDLLAKMHIF